MPRRSFQSVALLVLGALLASACAQFEDLPRLTKADMRFNLAQSSRIYDTNGGLITTLHGDQDRTIVTLKAIPRHVQRAVIAIEDERFYEHDGVDLRAVLRAAVANASTGEIREGGSTITQQYVKNVIIAPGETAARTITRKINEAALSRQLEQRLSKKEILRRYLNTVYFGNGAYGVQAAAFTYFNKPVSKLNLREAATLAGLIRSPETYDPFDNPKEALRRRNVVLAKMQELSWAEAPDTEKVARQKLKLRGGGNPSTYPAPYFVDYVQRLITYDPRFKAIGKTAQQRTQQLFQGGLRIYTTVDRNMQAAAEDAVASVLSSGRDPYGSLVAVDPRSGHVKAMVGGRDWFTPRKKDRFAKLNLAIQAEPNLNCKRTKDKSCAEPLVSTPAPGTGRQAGSAFKPFALAAAIRNGVPLSKTYEAKPCLEFPGADSSGTWRVCNYEQSAFGKIPLLEATAKSVNVVFARLILEGATKEDDGQEDRERNDFSVCALCQETVELARDMGIHTPLEAVPSAVLGANPVNPLGMAAAFGTFATNGQYHPPVAVTKIENAAGKVLYEDRSQAEQVLEPSVSYLTTTALQTVMERGTGVGAQIGRPAAGKTGTAQEYRDAWFAGYTPDLAAAAWVGYPEASLAMKTSCGGTDDCKPTRIQVTGGSWPADIWQRFMSRALAGVPESSFRKPAGGFVEVTIDARNGCLASRFTPQEYRVSATFAAGTEPEESCRESDYLLRVPDVLNFPIEDARRILTDAGFEVATVKEKTDRYPPGRVLAQDPGAGEPAEQGSTVVLVVSAHKDPQKGTVPDVLGQSRSSAEQEIQREGFEVRVVVQREGKGWRKRRGRVWKQDPSGGTKAEFGSTVTIWVNPD